MIAPPQTLVMKVQRTMIADFGNDSAKNIIQRLVLVAVQRLLIVMLIITIDCDNDDTVIDGQKCRKLRMRHVKTLLQYKSVAP